MPTVPWKVTAETWLRVETDRIQAIILMPKYWNRAWTAQSLKEALSEIGLDYSLPEVDLINDELHNRLVVVDLEP
jgi:hypothetical protein